MTEHKYAQVLRWIADGKKVQFRANTGTFVDECIERTLHRISVGLDGHEYRIAPRTVKVGDVEIEAPLDSAAHGSTAYFCDDFGAAHEIVLMLGSMHHAALLQSGRLFSSAEAAEAAHAAWVKLMRGDA